MSGPEQHLTAWGYVADFFDEIFEGNEKFLADQIRLTEEAARDRSKSTAARAIYGVANSYLWTGAVVHGVLGRFSQSYVDILRLGDSVKERSWAGVGKDALRLLNVIPMAGSAVSRLSKFALITQGAGEATCTWVSSANAIRRAGQRLFVGLEELARAGGMDLEFLKEIGTVNNQRLVQALNKLGIVFKEIPRPAVYIEDGIKVVEEMAKANPNGVLVVNLRYGATVIEAGEAVGAQGHSVCAQYIRGVGVVFTDTDKTVYRGVGELAKHYPNVNIGKMPTIFIPNATILRVANSPLLNLFLPVVPITKAATGAPDGTAEPPRTNGPLH